MKKLAYMFLIVGSLLAGANVVNAAGDGAKKKAKTRFVSCSEQTSQIKALIGSPDLVLESTSKVEVNFSLNEYNVITVNDVKTDNADLKKYVYSKMNGNRIHGNDVDMKDQKITLVFKPEQQPIFSVF
ncbi:MAG TPA: hypothetical protein VNB90_12220 [Cytophagaceae bacterium]|nr:hypothetical protein [Cytophagaceae bacterium]